MSLLEM